MVLSLHGANFTVNIVLVRATEIKKKLHSKNSSFNLPFNFVTFSLV